MAGTRLVFVVLIALLSFGCSTKEEVFTPEMLGEQVIITLSKNDPDAYKTLYIKPEEIKGKVQAPDDGFLDYYKFLYANTGVTFNRILAEGKQQGIIWEQAKYVSVQYHIILPQKKDNTDIYVNFTAGGKSYILKLDDCLLTTNRGWRLNDDVTFSKKAY